MLAFTCIYAQLVLNDFWGKEGVIVENWPKFQLSEEKNADFLNMVGEKRSQN